MPRSGPRRDDRATPPCGPAGASPRPRDEQDLSPQPSLSRLNPLIDKIAFVGLPVEVRISGLPCPQPVGIDLPNVDDLQATRILQHLPDCRTAGLSNSELAGTLTLSEATVKTHVARIFAKLAFQDRAQAVVLAYETGLVTPDMNAVS